MKTNAAKDRGDATIVFELLRSLWDLAHDDPRRRILPTDADSLRDFHRHLAEFIETVPHDLSGTIDSQAIVRGKIVAMGEGSRIEAGAVIHDSCRLVLGARSVVRAGAVLRDDVVVGPDCLIGVHCEVVRSLILGPFSYLGHFVYLGDSIVGSDVNIAGNVMVANTQLENGSEIALRYRDTRIHTGRTHLGALIGDRVRFGASSTLNPGCVILPGLTLPPHVALLGIIDAVRCRGLLAQFARTWHRR